MDESVLSPVLRMNLNPGEACLARRMSRFFLGSLLMLSGCGSLGLEPGTGRDSGENDAPSDTGSIGSENDSNGNVDNDTDDCVDMDGDGHTTCDDDCDDTNPSVYPFAGDAYNDGVDSDCDGLDCAAVKISGGIYFAACTPPVSDWNTIELMCRGAGYDGMASVQNETENSILMGLLSGAGMIWGLLGGSDDVVEGNWKWFDSTSFSYTNWNSGYYGGSTSENCMEMESGNGTWNDCPCSSSGSNGHMICQIRP